MRKRFTIQVLYAVRDNRSRQYHETYSTLNTAREEIAYLGKQARKAKTPKAQKALAEYIGSPINKDL